MIKATAEQQQIALVAFEFLKNGDFQNFDKVLEKQKWELEHFTEITLKAGGLNCAEQLRVATLNYLFNAF